MPPNLFFPHLTEDEEKQQAVMYLPGEWKNLRRLRFTVNDITSRATANYNCIAYAAKCDKRPWWPYEKWMPEAKHYYWPIEPVYPPTIGNFYEAFETLGFSRCRHGRHQYGYEKVAIYVNSNGAIQHMARELGDGVWFSKLGRLQDIRHYTLEGAISDSYGKPKFFMRKRIQGISRWEIIKRTVMRILSGSRT